MSDPSGSAPVSERRGKAGDTRRYGRRTLLLGTAGAGVVASVIGADPAEASADPVVLGSANVSATTTSITTAGEDCFEATTSGNGKSAIFGTDDSTAGGNGVFGQSTHGWGVSGLTTADGRSAVVGNDNSTDGGFGVSGHSGSGVGVNGVSTDDAGVSGTSTNGPGITGSSTNGNGVVGTCSANGSSAINGTDTSAAGGVAVYGFSDSGIGGNFISGTSYACYARTLGNGSSAVFGQDTSAKGGNGVYGQSANGWGVSGLTVANGRSGAVGNDESVKGGFGVTGNSNFGVGVHGTSDTSKGVGVQASSAKGVALAVDGVASFSRSGRAKVAGKKRKAESSVTVKGVALTSKSMVLATPQTYVADVAVAAVVPDVKAQSFTIHLTNPVKEPFTIAWFVIH